jgi:hypothetical protein
MIKKLLILGFLFFTIPPSAFASTSNGSCSWDGLKWNCQSQTTPDFNTQANQLKQQYGLTDFYACYPTNCNLDNLCYIAIQSCLETKAMIGQKPTQSTCGTGTVSYQGQCVSYDNFCQQSFGSNSQYWETDSTGRIGCECKTGFISSKDGKSCLPQPTQSITPAQSLLPDVSAQQTIKPKITNKVPSADIHPKATSTQTISAQAPEVKKPNWFQKVWKWVSNLF